MTRTPIPLVVQAPMAGGVSSPELAVAVARAGGLGVLAAGYRSPDGVRDDIRAVRAATDRPFGVNLLSVVERPVDAQALKRYARQLEPEAARYGAAVGAPAFDDDGRAAKLALLAEERVPIVSFAFACPSREEVGALQETGSDVWITVTEPAEVAVAAAAGADALVVQGVEAGGHRGTFDDADGAGEIGLLALLRLCAAETDLPLIAAGAIMDRHGVRAARAAGAVAVQCGTAFMLCPEAATSPAHGAAFATGERTELTRAFTGRRARGIVNRFVREHRGAPAGYPQVGAMVGPIRAAARAAGDAEAVNLWAGQAFALARAVPAAEVVAELSR